MSSLPPSQLNSMLHHKTSALAYTPCPLLTLSMGVYKCHPENSNPPAALPQHCTPVSRWIQNRYDTTLSRAHDEARQRYRPSPFPGPLSGHNSRPSPLPSKSNISSTVLAPTCDQVSPLRVSHTLTTMTGSRNERMIQTGQVTLLQRTLPPKTPDRLSSLRYTVSVHWGY